MQFNLSALVLAAIVALGAAAAPELTDEGVAILTADNFNDSIEDGVWLVEFYSPGCGFCKMLEPTWNDLAKEVAEDEIPMNVAKINIREAQEISKEQKIGKLPGVKLFRDGKVYTLPNGRNAREVGEYIEYSMETYEEVEQAEIDRKAEEIRKQAEIDANSDVVKLTMENFDQTVSEGNWLIEFYGPRCGYCKKFAPIWEDLATKVVEQGDAVNFRVAKTDAVDCHKYTAQFKANPWPSIKLLRDGKIYTFGQPRKFDLDLQDYIDWAEGGYLNWEAEEEREPIDEPKFLADYRKRLERKAKYAKKKKKTKKTKKEKKVHDEL